MTCQLQVKNKSFYFEEAIFLVIISLFQEVLFLQDGFHQAFSG